MENLENRYSYQLEEDEAEETLSFCNLSLMSDGENNSVQESPRASLYQEELFEFSINALDHENRPSTTHDILFGKFIHDQNGDDDEEKSNGYRKGDYLAAMNSHVESSKNGKESCIFKNRPSSARIDSYYSSISNVQKVNISALTSMSAKSKRRMFMFGPVKFMPEMELSAIKQRQGKLAPNSVVSKVVPGQDVVAQNGGGGEAGMTVARRHWGLLKSLRIRRSRLATMLARSFGCFTVASVEKFDKMV